MVAANRIIHKCEIILFSRANCDIALFEEVFGGLAIELHVDFAFS